MVGSVWSLLSAGGRQLSLFRSRHSLRGDTLMSEQPQYDRDSVERLLFQMDNMLHTRVNSLLLAETIFFLAAAAVWQHLGLLIIVALLGIITTILFGLTNLKLYFRVIWLIKQFKLLDTFYHDYLRMEGMRPEEWDCLSRFVFVRVTPDWTRTSDLRVNRASDAPASRATAAPHAPSIPQCPPTQPFNDMTIPRSRQPSAVSPAGDHPRL
jgi:hypothetical protein